MSGATAPTAAKPAKVRTARALQMLLRMERRRPVLALLHPAWLLALLLLALNDHVLKRIAASVVTGKLSDFAGLFIAPALLAVLVRATSRRAIAACHVAVAAGFALVKTFAPATMLFDRALSLVVRSHTITDPTDLIALPMVFLAYRVLVPAMTDTLAHAGHRFALVLGCSLSVATSREILPLKITVHNATGASLDLRVRKLASTISYDCTTTTPGTLGFTATMFEDLKQRTLGNSELATVIDGDVPTGCSVLWFEAEGLSPLVVTTGEGTVKLQIDRTDAGDLRWDLEPNGMASLVANPADDRSTGCVAPDDRYAIYDGPILPAGREVAVKSEAAGCLTLAFAAPIGGEGTVCVPVGAWPFGESAVLTIEPHTSLDGSFAWTEIKSATHRLVVGRGTSVPPAEVLPNVTFAMSDCGGDHDACGTVWKNGRLQVGGSSLAPGQDRETPAYHVWVTQASDRTIVDTACASGPPSHGLDIGVVVVSKLTL